MMKFVSLTKEYGIKTIVSMNPIMMTARHVRQLHSNSGRDGQICMR